KRREDHARHRRRPQSRRRSRRGRRRQLRPVRLRRLSPPSRRSLHRARADAGSLEVRLKIGGAYTVPLERQVAYMRLQDPEILARCMPGCDPLARIGDDEYEMKMKMVISSVKGLFGGKVRLADQSPPDSFRLLVEGSGKVGFVKGEGLLTLAPVDSSTEVRY